MGGNSLKFPLRRCVSFCMFLPVNITLTLQYKLKRYSKKINLCCEHCRPVKFTDTMVKRPIHKHLEQHETCRTTRRNRLSD